MVNSEELNRKIRESGLKSEFIAKKLGISRSTFYKKRANFSEFTYCEAVILGNLIGLTAKELEEIFLHPRSTDCKLAEVSK